MARVWIAHGQAETAEPAHAEFKTHGQVEYNLPMPPSCRCPGHPPETIATGLAAYVRERGLSNVRELTGRLELPGAQRLCTAPTTQ